MGACFLLLLLACLWLWFIKMWNWLACYEAWCLLFCLLLFACACLLSYSLLFYFSLLLLYSPLLQTIKFWLCETDSALLMLTELWIVIDGPDRRPRPTRPNQKKTKRQMPTKFKHQFLSTDQIKLVKVGLWFYLLNGVNSILNQIM
jgi:hypothetical protein